MDGSGDERRRGSGRTPGGATTVQPGTPGAPSLPGLDDLPSRWRAGARSMLSAGRNPTKARVYLVDDEGWSVVCKDYSRALRRRLTRPYTRWVFGHERAALRGLAGVAGVPGLLDAWATGHAMEFVAGPKLRAARRRSLGAETFDALDVLLDSIHARGRVMLDLHRHNVIVEAPGRVTIIDYELSLDVARGPLRLLRRPLVAFDRFAAARLRSQHGAPLGERHRRSLAGPYGWLYRAGHVYKSLRHALGFGGKVQ